MTPDEYKKVRAVFDEALRHDPEERDAFLEGACVDKPWLRAEVSSLLHAHDDVGNLEGRTQAAIRLLADGQTETLEGRIVGPYVIRHVIGRGGMGVVYLADDTRLSRRVALKALSGDVSSDVVRRERLRHEARAAAALSTRASPLCTRSKRSMASCISHASTCRVRRSVQQFRPALFRCHK